MQVLVIRPEPGLSATMAAGRALGLEMHALPLFEISPVAWEVPQGRFDGLLLGSANALRCGGAQLERLRHLPVHAVGSATAEVARKAGFTVSNAGQSDLQALIDAIGPVPGRLLRLCGRDRVALAPRAGLQIVDCPVYENRALPAPEALRGFADQGAVVLLHSMRAAQHFSSECRSMQLDRSRLALAALAPRIAAAAGQGWCAVRVAAAPHDQALLALAENICQ